MEEKHVFSWDELSEFAEETRTIKMPHLSKRAGKDMFCRVRGLQPMELLGLAEFPLGEIIAKAESEADAGELFSQHVETFDTEDMSRLITKVVDAGLVEPKTDGNPAALDAIKADLPTIYAAVMEMTNGSEEAVEDAARFPVEPERESD